MRKLIAVVVLAWCLNFPAMLAADECMEGDCDNGFGTGFTEDNRIYEGEWQDGMPHGRGKIHESRDRVVEGIWEKGELVKVTKDEGEKETREEK